MAVEDDDYIYYINRVGDIYGAAHDYLYKIKKNDAPRKDFCDLSYNTKVIPNRVWNLNLVDDWIYYSNWKDPFHHSINKVKKDGTEDTWIANEAAGNMFVEGNWIYYVKRTNSHSIDLNNIYKISLDGTCRIKLNSTSTEDMTVSNEWIYYTNISDGYKIYRMKLDGSENTKICDDETLFMTVCEDTVFYSNKSDDNKLYKINGDGTGKSKLSNNKATFINASKEYVYYVNYSDNENLYKIPASGGKSEKITNEYGTNFNDYKLSSELLKAISMLNFKEFTKVQKQIIPIALTEKDIVVKSQTGSGKTAAYAIPICQLVDWEENKPQALVITPTRELAIQVKEDIFNIGRFKEFALKMNTRPEIKETKGAKLCKEIMKLHINAGKKTKMRAVDIVGTLCNIETMTKDDIGIINIVDISTFVEILNNKGELVLRQLQKTPIKGRLRTVSKVDI